MKDLPDSSVYKEEYKYMPWGKLIEEVVTKVISLAPKNGKVLDLMCGPGVLLDELNKKRSDLQLVGVDISEEFIVSARKNKKVTYFCEDVFAWESSEEFDVVVCTAGMHHLPYEKQEEFIGKLKKLTKSFCVIADPYIDDFNGEVERKIAGAKLGYEYLVETIRNGAPKEVVEAALDVMYNDVLMYEWKTSVKKLKEMLEKYFSEVKVTKTWPEFESEYGDYCLVCS